MTRVSTELNKNNTTPHNEMPPFISTVQSVRKRLGKSQIFLHERVVYVSVKCTTISKSRSHSFFYKNKQKTFLRRDSEPLLDYRNMYPEDFHISCNREKNSIVVYFCYLHVKERAVCYRLCNRKVKACGWKPKS